MTLAFNKEKGSWEMTEAFVKVRRVGAKKWAFLSSGGSMNHLRVHAIRFKGEAAAQAFIDANASDNPGYEWKVSA